MRAVVATTDDWSLIDWARLLAHAAAHNAALHPEAEGWRYTSVASLLLDVGRLFTAATRPVTDRGEFGKCFRNASQYADQNAGGAYVEGLATRANTLGIQVEHAWFAQYDTAIDPTWPDGIAYLGVPFTAEFRLSRQLQTSEWPLLWSSQVKDLLHHGIPHDVLVDVGRPLPALTEHDDPSYPTIN
jgi:hypothetical protein